MRIETYRALLDLNRAFYETFAGDFAATRRGWPPGFARILPYLSPAANVLDVGCGNGRLLAFLRAEGWRGAYVGVDHSAGLLAEAGASAPAGARFVLADLLADDWGARATAEFREIEGVARAGGSPAPPDAIACLAVLHHIPGRENRVRLLAQCAQLLPAGSRLVLSTWQFMTSPRLRGRLLPWAAAGLRAEDVEPGDHLVAWGQGAAGQRYCASIPEAELAALAGDAGLAPVALFYADGHEGNLNLYGVFSAR